MKASRFLMRYSFIGFLSFFLSLGVAEQDNVETTHIDLSANNEVELSEPLAEENSYYRKEPRAFLTDKPAPDYAGYCAQYLKICGRDGQRAGYLNGTCRQVCPQDLHKYDGMVFTKPNFDKPPYSQDLERSPDPEEREPSSTENEIISPASGVR